MELLILIS